MKKNNFIEGTMIATVSIVLVKILGLLYVIPFYAIIGSQGGALYGYAYNIYTMFLAVSTTGVPIAISKIISEYNTLGYKEAKTRAFNIGRKMVSIISIISFLLLFLFAKEIAALIIGDLVGGNTIADVTIVIRVISFSVLIIPILSITRGYLQGHKYIAPSSKSQIIEQIVRIFVIICGSYIAFSVLHKSLTFTVSVALTGAFFGGIAAVIYLLIKIYRNKNELGFKKDLPVDNISNKEITRKILKYTVPYVILGLGTQIYTFVDMVLILRTLGNLGFSPQEVEFITSAITTWGMKLNMIINSLAMGLTISLIPNIVQSFVEKNWADVNNKINKTLEIITVIALPMTIGISFLAIPIWTIFYGPSMTGSTVLGYSIFTALFSTMYLTLISILQGLNKFKLSYIAAFIGFLTNAILDIPLMILFHKIGLPAYYGAITATIIGYSFTIIMSLMSLKKNHELSYKDVKRTFTKTITPLLAMIFSLVLLNNLIFFDHSSKTSSLIEVIIKSIISGTLYLIIAHKMGLFERVFGRASINRIVKKLSFNLIKLDDNN